MTLTYLIAVTTGLCACVTDVRTRRIPNLLTFGSAIAAVLFHLLTGGVDGAAFAAAGWLAGVAVFFLPFALGGLGAGDVKLVAALGAWLGPAGAIWVGLYAGLAGGVLALIVALTRGYLPQACRNIWLLILHWRVNGVKPLHDVTLSYSEGPRLAYGVAIFAGTLVTVWLH